MPEKILITDDDVDSLRLIGIMLQRQGYQVIVASSGNQALAKATSEVPDLIILDIMMPDMNGYEVCRRLRANPVTKSIPIIMFTAKTMIDDKVAGFEAGADDYLTKPTHPAELASRVKAMLTRTPATPAAPPTAAAHEPPAGYTVGIIGTKGGLGVSTLALNLATALRKMGEAPLLADFCLGRSSLNLYMGAENSGMGVIASRPAAQITRGLIEEHIVTSQAGVRALLASNKPQESLQRVPPETLQAITHSLRRLGRPVIYDLGAGYSPLVHNVHRDMERLIVIVEPAGVSLKMARELLQELGKNGKHRIDIVVFTRTQIPLQLSWHDVEHELSHKVRGVISPAPELAFRAVEAGVPFVLHEPNAVVSSQVIKLAETIKAALPKKHGGEMIR